jgi:GR25 family glycosyltransferase involved in LPS biosynthesis
MLINNFVDKVFIISLPERKSDRLDVLGNDLDSLGIEWVKFDALRNKEGYVGLIKTMHSLFSIAKLMNYENILVFEDDAKFIEGTEGFISECLQQLPKDYHCLHLGANLLVTPTRVCENILKITASYALHATFYSKQAINLILPLLEDETQPIDVSIMRKIQPLGKCYCSNPMIFTQRATRSDIFDYNPNVHRGLEGYYNKELGVVDFSIMMEQNFKRLTSNL